MSDKVQKIIQRKGLWDAEKVIEYMKKNSRFNYLLETDWEVLEDLRKSMEKQQ